MLRRPHLCLAALLIALSALISAPALADAKEARGVGYVLSFRMGVEQDQAKKLVGELAAATKDWLGLSAKQGATVSKRCGGDRECVRAAAASLGVSRLGIVTIVAAGGVVRLEVRLVDASTGSEILRTHAEFESAADNSNAKKAIYDLIPRLLPGEKVAPKVAKPTPPPKDPVVVPPVTQIPASPPPSSPGADLSTSSPKKSGTRWWLWGGLGAAATASIVAAILITRDDGSSAPVLELPPPQ